jgi:predicted nucleotidyltransferase
MSQQEINKIIIDYLMPYEPVKIGLFGSYARNEETPESDIDILINIRKRISLFDLAQIYFDLEEKLGKKVDIVTERSIKNERFKKRMERDLKIIYES